MHPLPHPQLAQRRVRPGERDQRDLHEVGPGERVNREAHAVHRDRPLGDAHLAHPLRHAQVAHQHVASLPPPPLLDPHHLRHAVHVPLHEVAAQPVRRAHRALQVDAPAPRVLREQRPVPRGLHHVGREPAPHHALHGQARPIHRNALAALERLVGRTDPEDESPFPLPPSPALSPVPAHLRDGPDRGHDPGKHSRLSNTSNVSGPRERRSTAIQRGACSSGAPGMPGKAGTAPSPSHTGAWTQYSRSTSPSVRSRAPRAPPPSHNTDWIPASRNWEKPAASEAGPNTRTPVCSSAVTLAGGASREDITQVGTSRAVATRVTPGLSIARRSKTTRTGGLRGVTAPRTVRRGLSCSAVVPPTAIASNPARSQWV